MVVAVGLSCVGFGRAAVILFRGVLSGGLNMWLEAVEKGARQNLGLLTSECSRKIDKKN